ncbi:MAG: hypothetical protein AMXMBFR56_00190 [Polyangiaceae bacterium]
MGDKSPKAKQKHSSQKTAQKAQNKSAQAQKQAAQGAAFLKDKKK